MIEPNVQHQIGAQLMVALDRTRFFMAAEKHSA